MNKEQILSNIIVSIILLTLILIMSGINKIMCTKITTKKGKFSMYVLSMFNFNSLFIEDWAGNYE